MPIATPWGGWSCPRARFTFRGGNSRGKCSIELAVQGPKPLPPVSSPPAASSRSALALANQDSDVSSTWRTRRRRPGLRGRRFWHRPAPSTAGSEDPSLLWGLSASTRRLWRLPIHELPVRCRHTTRDRRFSGAVLRTRALAGTLPSSALSSALRRAPPRSRRPSRLPGLSDVRSAAPLLHDLDLKEPFRSSRSGLACLAQPRAKLGSDEWCVQRQNHPQTQSTSAC